MQKVLFYIATMLLLSACDANVRGYVDGVGRNPDGNTPAPSPGSALGGRAIKVTPGSGVGVAADMRIEATVNAHNRKLTAGDMSTTVSIQQIRTNQ